MAGGGPGGFSHWHAIPGVLNRCLRDKSDLPTNLVWPLDHLWNTWERLRKRCSFGLWAYIQSCPVPTLPDSAGDSLKVKPTEHTHLITSLIGETFYLICYMQFDKSPWLVRRTWSPWSPLDFRSQMLATLIYFWISFGRPWNIVKNPCAIHCACPLGCLFTNVCIAIEGLHYKQRHPI